MGMTEHRSLQTTATDHVSDFILTLRATPVLVDADLATLYGVSTKALNQAVQRNIDRFPSGFKFQITQEEKDELVTNCDRFKKLKHSSALPHAFTEQGVAMISVVLKSDTAVKTSIAIIQAFVAMRQFIQSNGALLQRMDTLELRQLALANDTQATFEKVFSELADKNTLEPTQGVFFEGQIFDAYRFVSDLLRQAKHSVVLIDNYIDDRVLDQLNKRASGVNATILCKKVSRSLQNDLDRHNAQYPAISAVEFEHSHDRFLILDGHIVYHLGASLKDLGNKWFAFSKLDESGLKVMDRVTALLP
jgi:hypothetical protein